jgi:hypothetical protein
MGKEESEGYVMAKGSRGQRFSALLIVVVAMVVAAVVVTVAAPDAGPAWAATPTLATIESTQFTVQAGQIGEAPAVCPGTKRALGGGVVQSGTPDGLNVGASGPLDGTGFTSQTVTGDVARQWYAAVLNSTGVKRNFKVFAICSGDSSAKIKATAFSVEDLQTGEAFAKCASTKRAVGGGVVQSGSAERILMRASGPLDATGFTVNTNDGDTAKQWYAAQANSSGVLREFKVFAICE